MRDTQAAPSTNPNIERLDETVLRASGSVGDGSCIGPSPGVPFLAVSVSSDPMQDWLRVELPLPQFDPGMKIGVDKNGLYISCANGSDELIEGLDLYVIPKADAITPGGPVLTRAQTFSKLVYAAFPAVDLDAERELLLALHPQEEDYLAAQRRPAKRPIHLHYGRAGGVQRFGSKYGLKYWEGHD